MQSSRHCSFLNPLKEHALEALLLVLATLFLYGRTVGFDFVWDDKLLILKNPFLQQDFNFYKIFTSNFWSLSFTGGQNDLYYRPLVTLAYFFEYKLFGSQAAGYHAVNVLLHTCSMLLLHRISIKMGLGSKARIMACLLFSIHPVQSSTITFISSHSDLLSEVFSLGAIYLWISGLRVRWVSLVLIFLAMLCKEVSVIIPVVLIFWDVIIQKKSFKNINTFVPFILYIPYFLLRTHAVDHSISSVSIMDVFTSGGGYRLTLYLGRLLAPFPISPVVYIHKPATIFCLIFNFLVLIFMGFLVFRKNEKKNVFGFFIFWFFLSILPIMDWTDLGIRFSDQLLYTAMAPFSLIVGVILSSRILFKSAVFISLVIVCSTLSIHQQNIWKNNLTLWKNVLSYEPENVNFKLSYALALKEYKSESLGCNEMLELAGIAQKKNYPEILQTAFYNLGNCNLSKQPAIAEKYYRSALQIKNSPWIVYNNLVVSLLAQKKNHEAVEEAQMFTKQMPDSPVAWKMLGIALYSDQNIKASIEALQKAQTLGLGDPQLQGMILEAQSKLK